ncbi:MAG: transcriptional regulator [Actinomycetota bacterium]|nr:transcriptional regulator [Actinomycetota bacterium]
MEELFSAEVLGAARRRRQPRAGRNGQALRARIGRFGRQPAYWLLYEKRIRRVELVKVTGCSQGRLSQILNGSALPTPSFVEATCELLEMSPSELFTEELLKAVEARASGGLVRPPPSRRPGRYGRQPAYWRLREQGITQTEVASILGRSVGGVSWVLNGHSAPDRRLVEALSRRLQLDPSTLFTEATLQAPPPQHRSSRLARQR